MKNKCLLVLLLALGYCHVQAQKSQKDPLSEALVRLNQKVDSELIPGIKRFPLIGISTDIKAETDSRKHGICTVSHSLWRNSLHDTCNG